MKASCCICFFSLLTSCLAANYVMFPMFSRSHYLVIAKVGEELAARGHWVEIFVGDTETYAVNSPLARQYNTSHTFKMALEEISKHIGKSVGGNVVTEMKFLASIQSLYCDGVLGNNEVMKSVKRADLVVGDSLYMCGSLIADKVSLPYVVVFTNSLSTPTAHAFSLPLCPSYLPQFKSALGDNLNFFERIQNVYQWIAIYWAFHVGMVPPYKELKDKYQIAPNKDLYETLGRVDLIIGQVGFFLDYPRPILPNTRVVGPLLTSPSKPLPRKLEEFMQSSGDDGVIVAAFGTTLGALDKHTLAVMARAFAQFPQKFIWKLNAAESSAVTVSDNVKVVPWMPQNDVIGHPKTRLFIGHGGLNGMFESIYHGVPMILSPFFGDQFDNARFAKAAGFAEVLPVKQATAEELVSIIHKVLSDSSYRKSAARISKSIKQLPRTPAQEAADWVEYTQAQGGLQYLRPRGLDMSFYQLYFLDMLLLATLIVMTFFLVVMLLVKFIKNSVFKKKEKEN